MLRAMADWDAVVKATDRVVQALETIIQLQRRLAQIDARLAELDRYAITDRTASIERLPPPRVH